MKVQLKKNWREIMKTYDKNEEKRRITACDTVAIEDYLSEKYGDTIPNVIVIEGEFDMDGDFEVSQDCIFLPEVTLEPLTLSTFQE